LFNTIDPSPFLDRDLDRDAEEYIVSSARELSSDVPLTLVVYVEQSVELTMRAVSSATQSVSTSLGGRRCRGGTCGSCYGAAE
jgi:hypothetical protein